MTFEQMERTMQFILEQQAEFTVRQSTIEENFKKFQRGFEKLQTGFEKLESGFERLESGNEKLQHKLDVIAGITRDLLTVAQIHSRRLDRLEGLDNN